MSGRAEFALQFERVFGALEKELGGELNDRTVNALKEEFLETNQKELPDGTIDQEWNDKLEEIWNDNLLRELPKNIGQMKSLYSAHLGNNQLKDLPSSFSDLKKLGNLSLVNNQFNEVPEVLEKIELSALLIYGNPILKLPKKIGILKMKKDGIYGF